MYPTTVGNKLAVFRDQLKCECVIKYVLFLGVQLKEAGFKCLSLLETRLINSRALMYMLFPLTIMRGISEWVD